MNLFRKTLAKVRLVKFRANKFWTEIPDTFWLLDRFLIMAGVHFEPQNGWQRFSWKLYLSVGYFQMLISLVSCVSTLYDRKDNVVTLWSAIMVASEVICLLKHRHLVRHDEDFKQVRQFLTTTSYSSGDQAVDEATRNRFRNKSRVLVVTVGLLIVLQQLLCWIPNTQQLRMLYIPPWIGVYFGRAFAITLQVIYISMFDLFWVSKLFSCTIVSTVLIMELQAEQEILVHHFEQLEEGLDELRENYHDSTQTKQQYWDRLKSHLKTMMDQQVVILNQLSKLQSMIEVLFFYIYYFALIAVGSTYFILLSEKISFMHFVITGNITITELECYLLSLLIENFKDSFDAISGHVFGICAQLPYSADHRQDYIGMRTTLTVVAHCSRNIVQFGCAGLSDITVNVFAELVNTSYSVLTFLMNMI